MNGSDVRRLSAGTVTFQMRLRQPVWSLDDELPGRLVDVEVEVRALMRLSRAGSTNYVAQPTLSGNRHAVEQAAQRIIDNEGPYFTQPVRVRAVDVCALVPLRLDATPVIGSE